MAALAGIGASVTEAAVVFSDSSKWTLSMKGATKDATPFGAAGSWAINVATVKSWTAKVSAFLDAADTAQTNMLAGLNNTFSLTLTIVSTPHAFTGSAILTGIDPVADVQGLVTVDYTFTGSGAITYS